MKDGYGRNFLIPQKKAVIASASAKSIIEDNKQRAHKIEKLKNDALALAEKLAALTYSLLVQRSSSNGKIFGAVNSTGLLTRSKKQGTLSTAN